MKKIDKPDIRYKPKKIDSKKFGIPPYYKYYCEYHKQPFPDEESYNLHMAKYHPGSPKDEFGDLKPFDESKVKDKYASEEQRRIDSVLSRIDMIEGGISFLDDMFDNELNRIEIPYDPNKYSLLDESVKCPYCGDPNASNVIDGKAFRIKEEKRNDINMRNVSYNNSDGSPGDILSRQDSFLRMIMTEMLMVVWNQVVIWILEFLYSILKFLESIPFVKEIPKALKRMIDSLRKRNNLNVLGDNKYDNNFGPVGDSSDAGKTVYVNGNTKCLVHLKNFQDFAENILLDTAPRGAIMLSLKRNNSITKSNIKTLKDEVLSMKILNGYEYGNGKTYNNNSSSKPITGGPLSDIESEDGVIDKILDETEDYINKARKLFERWTNSSEMVCCFIYNLTTIFPSARGSKNLKSFIKILKTLNGFLKFKRYLVLKKYTSRVFLDLGFISGLINNIVHDIIRQHVLLLTDYFENSLNFWLKGVYKIKNAGYERPLKICVPFDEFVRLLPRWFRDISLELNKYLKSLWGGMTDINHRAIRNVEEAIELLSLDAYINFLDRVEKYLKFWIECSEETGYTGYTEGSVVRSDVLQKAKKKSTLYNRRGITKQQSLEEMTNDELDSYVNNLRQTIEVDKSSPWTYEGMKVLLTNFVGVSPYKVDEILKEDSKGCCQCANGFKPEEIEKIKGLF